MSFFEELKRRNVLRVGITYVLLSWLVLQVADVILGNIPAPAWVFLVLLSFLALGLPFVLVFAWVFEWTPEGIRRESEIDRSQSVTARTGQRLNLVITGVLVLAVGFLLVERFYSRSTDTAEVADPVQSAARVDSRISLGVIPFVNMSDDEQNEYFSDGISEELLNVLVSIEGLRVPSRTSSFTFKSSKLNASEIGQQLGVDHLLEGSVRKSGDRIRVTAQLVDVKTDTHLWSETYTRKLDDIFAVQDEIAQAIVAALELTLSGADNKRLGAHSTFDIEAYNKYLLGRYLWNQRSGKSLLAAIEPLRKAVELDPGFSQAWAALADTYVLIPEYNAGSVEEFIPLAREATQRALAIDPESAQALTTSGYYKALFDFDWEGSNRDFQQAIALEPGYATAHQWYAETLVPQGRLEEAHGQIRLAAQADPLSVVIRHTPGYFLLYSNRLDEAEAVYMATLELNPNFRWTHQNLDILHTLKGNYAEARKQVMQLAQMEDFDPAPDLARLDAMENPDLKPRALELLQQRQDMRDGVFGKAMQFALLGEYAMALENLEAAFAANDPWAIHMNWVFVYKPLHGNPRFQAMLRRMHEVPR